MKRLAYLSIGATLLFASCSSPLSDTPISDPGLITPNVVIEHADDDYGVSNKVSTCLMDKNGAYIELLEGDVQVNGDLMEFSITCYKRSISVKEDDDYTVVVTLADSTAYPFKVHTPTYFKKVDFPGKIKEGETFEVSWKGDFDNETKVNFSVQDTTNNWIVIFEEYTTKNYIEIDPDNFPKGDISKGMITLTRSVKGSVPNGFNGGSVTARCIFQRTIKIK